MKKSIFQKVLIATVGLAIATFVMVPVAGASQPRDYNSNSIIYGGAYSISELKGLLKTGVNRDNCVKEHTCPYQTAADLQNLYTKLGMNPSTWDNLVDGRVYKDGHVEVNGKTVKTGVQTMGRHYLNGSTRDNSVSYPVYWRKPSVSFNSNSIPAFVLMNYDGTMAFGITKSCGNPIKGVGIKVKPTPKYNLTITKFNDQNGDKVHQASEPLMANWSFEVTGKNYDKTVTTDKSGSVAITGLNPGSYTVKEIQKTQWTSTTGLTRTVNLSSNQTIWFGNRQIPVIPQSTFSIKARKFEDVNGNAKHEETEAWIQGWKITLTGNGVNNSMETDLNGTVVFTNLPAGTYKVSEESRTGWKNITPLIQTVTLPDPTDPEPEVDFGNQQVKPTVITAGISEVTTTTPLPTAGPEEAIIGSIATVGLGSAGIYLRKSRMALKKAFKKF